MASDKINLINVMRDFKNFEPELHKSLTKSLNTILKEVVTTARGLVLTESPMSGWSVNNQKGTWASKAYDPGEMRAGFSVTRSGGLKRTKDGTEQAYALYERSTAAVIYDFAGTLDKSPQPDTNWHRRRSRPGRPVHKKQNKLSPQGSSFIANIAIASGVNVPKHRLGVLAVIKKRPEIIMDLQNAIDKEVKNFNARMNARVTL